MNKIVSSLTPPKPGFFIALVSVIVVAGALIMSGIISLPQPKNTSRSPSPAGNAQGTYPLHTNIRATVFWAGENADSSNDFIHNRSSAWASDWVSLYGGVDDPADRCEYAPCGFTPKENPFYFALPFGDATESGPKPDRQLQVVPWYDDAKKTGEPLLKNRWIKVTRGDKTAYAQWEDVGPFEENDAAYVFGDKRPKEPRAGLDMSPALADYLAIDGAGNVDWRFVNADEVPDGPWKQIITRSKPEF